MCGHEGVSALLGVQRRLLVVDEVMPEKFARLFGGRVEGMGSAGIDDDLEIGLARDGLTFRSGCPVVFVANQDENGNRRVYAFIAERIVSDDPCNRSVMARRVLRVG